MSIMIFIVAFALAKNGVTIEATDFFIAWALFSISDAMWIRFIFK